MKLEHLGLAVKDVVKSNDLYTKLLGSPPYKQELVESENVLTSFFRVGESKLELIQSIDENSSINRFIEKKGEGLHHIAFRVDDLKLEIKRLRSEGFEFINEEPKLGADDMLIAFIHPKFCEGVLVELCQKIEK